VFQLHADRAREARASAERFSRNGRSQVIVRMADGYLPHSGAVVKDDSSPQARVLTRPDLHPLPARPAPGPPVRQRAAWNTWAATDPRIRDRSMTDRARRTSSPASGGHAGEEDRPLARAFPHGRKPGSPPTCSGAPRSGMEARSGGPGEAFYCRKRLQPEPLAARLPLGWPARRARPALAQNGWMRAGRTSGAG